ncbi:ABC-type branched-subunit amino acid transport system substrate-binding protein [Bradyrhizobium sp. LM2.7]
MTRALGLVPAVALAAALFASAAEAQTIKIGVNQPLTGAFAASGTYVVNGAKIAADEINAKGGILGKKIELVIEDNKSNPTEAAAVAEKLITSDKVPVLMGAWGSSLTLAVMPKLIEYETPMVVETSSSGKITTTGNPFIFRISPPSAVEAAAFRGIVDKLALKKVDFLVINNDWGRGTAEDFSKMMKDKGISIGLVETMDQGAQDMSAQLSKIKSSDSETVIVTTAVDQLTLIFKQARRAGTEEAHHHHRRFAEPGPDHRAGGSRRQRHHASDDVPAVVPGQDAESGSHQLLHCRMEEARLRVRRLHRELPRV